MTTTPKKIVIAGGGTAGWIAAAALARKMGPLVDVRLIESETIGTIGVGEATIPPLRTFHKLLQIDEQAFMRATSATFKLGIQFENWGHIGERYIHSFGVTGQQSWLAEFVHFFLSAKEKGLEGTYGDYCFELEAARQHKFATSQQSNIQYAYHLDAGDYVSFLKRFCSALNVTRTEGVISRVAQHDNGDISALHLESGEIIEGDFFIDCTGFKGLLIEETLETGFEDWSHWLLCDSACAVQTESTQPAPPYTRAAAHHAGWQWEIPLQHRVGNGLVYSSKFMDDEEARQTLLKNVKGEPLTSPRTLRFKTGRRKKAWHRNCLALGLASGFVEPLESTSIHLVMMGITRFMQLFPHSGHDPALIDEYNSQTQAELERIRDFIILHYHVTARDDSPFWQHCKDMQVPDSLISRITLFKEQAHAFQKLNELFRVDSWTQVMLGQGITPTHYHPAATMLSEDQLKNSLRQQRERVLAAVKQLPEHADFVKGYCGR
ncbi:tryptophan halogenase family protein [Salinimonas iocasae]|uniref:Tryptophan 7-halogenase n=1 Tax=Salinimonas iocasae TaxID=2572577 RepID=A0A5B7Y8A5_9ALTE|nr:tryptophan halogenase family protein [Salinimonas iocasae]QCZ92027.1 tryptophan 7-halogenase [Salinimonas iocasae]